MRLRWLLLVALCATACTAPAAPSGSPSDEVASARRADLDQLVDRLVAIHRNPFLEEGEAAFRARVDAVAAHAGDRSDVGFLVDVMGLMGHRDRDGHSGAWAMAQTGDLLHARPLWLREFPDGLRIVAARAPYEDPGRVGRGRGRWHPSRGSTQGRHPARAGRQ
jgi:hypothetical protein